MQLKYELLKTAALFEGIAEKELEALLTCLSAKVTHYDKSETVLMYGADTSQFGIVLAGHVQVINEDYYGNRSIVAIIEQGMLFGEAFAFADVKTLPVSVLATAESDILFINFRKLITTCSEACTFHSKIIYNMLHIVAAKNLLLSQKIEFISKRTTREKLLAYLSAEAQKAGSNHFIIPFNRQELADFLSVDRSAMSAELSKLREEGFIQFHKNQFELL